MRSEEIAWRLNLITDSQLNILEIMKKVVKLLSLKILEDKNIYKNIENLTYSNGIENLKSQNVLRLMTFSLLNLISSKMIEVSFLKTESKKFDTIVEEKYSAKTTIQDLLMGY